MEIDPVSDDTPIWRYMDVPKFVSMLATETLWFTKAALLHDDPYEGFSIAIPLEVPPSDDGPKWITHTDDQGTQEISVYQMLAEIGRRSAQQFERARDHLYVNSWCLAEESMAMWQIYGASGSGIAVQSSVGQYRRASKFQVPESQYSMGKVDYHTDITACRDITLDPRQGTVTVPGSALWDKILKLGFHKRACFKYEQEWRCALYQDFRPEVAGCNIDFDLDTLINRVYIGPRAEGFLDEVVDSIMRRFELRKPLERSALLTQPSRSASSSAG